MPTYELAGNLLSHARV